MRKILISLLVAQLFCGQSFSQENSYTDGEGRVFLPNLKGELTVKKDIGSGFQSEYPGESAAKCLETLSSFSNLLSSWKGLNPPVGAKALIFEYVSERTHLSLDVSAFQKDPDTGEIIGGGSASSMYIHLNDIMAVTGNPIVGDIIATPQKVYDFHGYPVYRTNMGLVAIISPVASTAYIPCSKEKYIKAVIDREEQFLAIKSAATDVQPDENPSDIKAEMNKSLKEMEATYQTLLKQDKKLAAEFKLSMELMKKEVESINLTPDPGSSREELINAELDPCKKKISALKRELSGMSEAEKRMQAYLSEDISVQYGEGSGLLRDSQTNGGIALSSPNPLLVKKGIAMHVPQMLAIRWIVGNSSNGTPMGFNGESKGFGLSDKILYDLSMDKLLWNKVFSLVK